MHSSYDASRQPYQSQIPAMRPSYDATSGHSPTPIYDALYSEYRRAFKALPGDRSGEEDLDFKAFGAGLHSSHPVHQTHVGSWQPYQGSRAHHGTHVPAALPPGPRRGT
ncbi:hypothetical protein [Streptomyces sp. NBC_01481]|uniref:hypothetical protein n=1 Tax=Streptomyces sp. NBC_01481 TaxID=2975869 RepID=UPI002256EA29|nr:hypothetical protein [Streptomyces sp. NBC_01481]MCX4583142.1 hypothetical protein [Streptomyces sp. NBC_01481]